MLLTGVFGLITCCSS